jgi:hypothetical protein
MAKSKTTGARGAKPAKTAKAPKAAASVEKGRFWLMYPPRMIKTPILWELGRKFDVVTNVRQASVTDEIGIVCLELDGKRAEIDAAVAWLEKTGINVEPVEINAIAS